MPSADVIQNVLAPAGTQSSPIYQLWSVMLLVSAVVFAVTMVFVAAALRRGLRRVRTESISSERTLTRGRRRGGRVDGHRS